MWEKEQEIERISVIIPIYKTEKYLECCVDSVKNQTYTNLEIILVDDGSPDKCGEICDRYQREDKRIKVIHQKNAGISAARNAGIKEASGEYIFLVDSDDYIALNTLEILYKAIKEEEADLTLCNIQYVDEYGRKITKLTGMESFCVPKTIWTQDKFWKCYMKKGKIPCVVAWNKLYKKELFEGISYPTGKIREDEFFIHLIIDRCQKISCVKQKLCFYRQHEKSIMHENKYSINQMDIVDAYLERAEYFRKKGKNKFTDVAIIDAIAFLEWYNFGRDRSDKKINERYVKLRNKVCEAGRRELRYTKSVVSWCVIWLYIKGLLPYKIIRFTAHKIEDIKSMLKR